MLQKSQNYLEQLTKMYISQTLLLHVREFSVLYCMSSKKNWVVLETKT